MIYDQSKNVWVENPNVKYSYKTNCLDECPGEYYLYSNYRMIDVLSCIGGSAAASPPPIGIGDPALCGSQPLVTPVFLM